MESRKIMDRKPAELAAQFYDEIIDLHHEEFNYVSIQYRKWLDLLSSRLKKGGTVLDLGCGNGRAMRYLMDKGFQAIGVDVSDKMLEMARKHVPRGKFYKKDFTRLGFKPGSMDAVISFFALNHIPKSEFRKVMITCSRFLKRDGFLLLGMVKGNDEGLFRGFYGKKMQLYGAGYKEEEIVDILKSAGYEIIKKRMEHFKGKHFEEDDVYVFARVKK